jgi:pimeloyl-[acyl-carrier protein] methyl ester esterase
MSVSMAPTAEPIPRAGEVIAMHGWAGQSTDWAPWRQLFESLGWCWQSAERGYGILPPAMPRWGRGRWRLLITHSLGLHLVPPPLLEDADGVALLASFGRFIPPGPEGRRLRAAIEGMLTQLSDPPPPSPCSDGMGDQVEATNARRAWTMLQSFMEEAAAPDPLTLLPPGGVTDSPPGPLSRQRLRQDLLLLRDTRALPDGFPRQARVLIVEAEQDHVVAAGARAALREALPEAEIRVMAGAGHALLQAPVREEVLKWLTRAMPRDP